MHLFYNLATKINSKLIQKIYLRVKIYFDNYINY